MENKKDNISSLGLGIRVKTLVNLRWIAVLGQTITCFIVHYFSRYFAGRREILDTSRKSLYFAEHDKIKFDVLRKLAAEDK